MTSVHQISYLLLTLVSRLLLTLVSRNMLRLYLLIPGMCRAQQTILTGRVTDQKGESLPGANVFLRGTYDGVNTDSTGAFRFATTRKDTATLLVSFVGYEPWTRKITIGQNTPLLIRLTELANELNTVVISAGIFEASDEKRMTMLKPIDIVTTAGAGADITAVMNLLPGAQRVGEQQGLFVRGGSGAETNVVIDGLIVQNPYFSALPDVQTRGRFQPFMFKGTAFSTGGYSAQYGQALSSVLLLNTVDKGNDNGLSIGLNLVSANLSYDHATERSSISATGYYGNLKPLFALVPQNQTWSRPPAYAGSSLTYRLKTGKTGLLKVYGMYSDSWLGLNTRNPAAVAVTDAPFVNLSQQNRNLFSTGNYTDSWADGNWLLNAGLSYSYDTNATTYDTQDFGNGSQRLQARAVLTRLLPKGNSVLFGAEAHRLILDNSVGGTTYSLYDTYGAIFAETQTYLGRKLAIQAGVRGEYSSVIARGNVAPRLSMAYKTGAYSQVSAAYGQFYQTPDSRYLYRNPNLNFERADHLILNYQRIKDKRTFRVEAFHKNYAQLVREFVRNPDGTPASFDANPYRFPIGQTTNTGSGYAQGIDLFWRDQETVKGLDYWLTYSYVDTKRLFQNYIATATPTFISNHNVSVITKRYVEKISTNFGLTYTFTSGRPYYNPNRLDSEFLTDRTPAVNNLSFSASHIRRIKKNLLILYATADNLLNTRNVFAYRYAPDGKERYAIGPTSYRSFFVGGIIMLSQKASVNVNEL